MKRSRIILLLSALLFSLSAQADGEKELHQLLSSSLEKLMTMTVSISTSTKQTLSKAPSVVSVITADDIRATGATDLMDVLQGVPGLYVRRNQFGFKPLISFRGTDGTRTLLMINGAPAKDLVWSPGIFWKGVPANAIERVEIIRGPGSALYGSDASSGVINVVTKTAGKIQHSEAGVRLASFDSQAAWLQHGAEWNGFEIGLTVDASTTGGHRPYIASDRLGSAGEARYGWDGQDVRFSLTKDHWRLLADYTRHRNVEIGLTGGSYLDPLTRANDSQTSLALLYANETFVKDWGLNAELRYRDLEYSSGNGFWDYPPGPGQLLSQLNSAERRINFEASALYRGFRAHALRIGGGHVWQDLYFVSQIDNGVPVAFAPEKLRKNSYLFLQDVWTFAQDWELTAGARYDHYSDFGGTLNPRLALVWQTTDKLATKLMYGKAFRAPTFLELYADTAASDPNPGLKPERSRTWELSFSYAASRQLELGLNLFDAKLANMIALDAASKYQNAGEQTFQGIELEADWLAARTLKLSGNLSYRRQERSPFILYGVPTREAYLRADWQFKPKWNWNLQANWIGGRPQSVTDTRHLGNQALVDTTIRYYHGSDWEFAASIRNLFDKVACEYTGTRVPNFLPLPRRNLFAEVRYKF